MWRFFFSFSPQSGARYQANQKLSSLSTLCHTREGPEGLEIVAFIFLKSRGIKPGILDDTVSWSYANSLILLFLSFFFLYYFLDSGTHTEQLPTDHCFLSFCCNGLWRKGSLLCGFINCIHFINLLQIVFCIIYVKRLNPVITFFILTNAFCGSVLSQSKIGFMFDYAVRVFL